ncbi:NADH kinase POS5 [Pleurostoma richardsiae]|uniref:NADH kinase POS5 n=1 Tax=Pleurostoma richardsiae TaxID=41990 RepID=A0AA38RM57_9PEZI|nr:NADH kinase POS5 [Pleurostoma richardsiae]
MAPCRTPRTLLGLFALPCSPPLRRISRPFSATFRRSRLLDVSALPDRIIPQYRESPTTSLLSLHWPRPPRNILLVPKLHAPEVTLSAVAFAKHLHSNYPDLNLVFESRIASRIHEDLTFPIYTTTAGDPSARFPGKIDLVTTLGGDGTILRAASIFSLQASVPPILSFSMGSLGFLGEWKFDEYKRAWREVYMSGSSVAVRDLVAPHTQVARSSSPPGIQEKESSPVGGWESVRGKSMGPSRTSKILLRHRLRVGVYDGKGRNMNAQLIPTSTAEPQHSMDSVHSSTEATPLAFHAINELLIHRGPHPHLAVIDIYLNNHFLTEAVADGILGGVPCVIRAPGKGDGDGIAEDDDSWVSGLNSLLKFNYPFGEMP